MYFWVWTSGNRATGIAVLNQMCRHHELNITFYSDSWKRVNSWNSREALKQVEANSRIKERMEEYEERSVGHMPKLVWQDSEECHDDHYLKNGTLNNKCLYLSSDVWGATVKLMSAECGDKTFLLISLFTMAWSTWHLKEHASDEEIHGHEEEEKETPGEANENKEEET